MKYTHKGWFWFCPIYLSPDDPEFPVEARHWMLEPVFSVCDFLEHVRIWVSSVIWPDYEPSFMMMVTGELGSCSTPVRPLPKGPPCDD